MANTNDVVVAALGLMAAIVGGSFIVKSINKRNKNRSKIKQFGIGHVSNSATVNQTATNAGNDQRER